MTEAVNHFDPTHSEEAAAAKKPPRKPRPSELAKKAAKAKKSKKPAKKAVKRPGGRPMLYPDKTIIRMPAGFLKRVNNALKKDQCQGDFMRAAIATALKARRK